MASEPFHPVGSPGAPSEGDDAGSADEYWKERRRRTIESSRTLTESLFAQAIENLGTSVEASKQLAREALQAGAETYWYAEQTDAPEAEHSRLHEIGRWTRQNVGCHLDFDGTSYSQSCPVKMADKRIGLSMGLVARRWCSICDGDFSQCDHLPQRMYWVTGGPTGFGPCRVCRSDECCHSADKLYQAPTRGRIRAIDAFEEVSFVDVPADPLARLKSIPIDTGELCAALGDGFEIGMPVSCDHCLEPYHGLPPDSHIADLTAEDSGQPEAGTTHEQDL